MNKNELIRRRKALGFTRDQLARELGRGYQQLSRWETGAPIPVWVSVALIGLEVSIQERWKGTNRGRGK